MSQWKCDVADTSNRKGIRVYRVLEFLYSHMIWVPQRGGSKNLKNLFCKYVLKFNLAPITGSDFLIFFLKLKIVEHYWTNTLASIYIVSSYLPPHTHVFCRTLVAKAELY
jgi:hypothetical protein